MKIKIKVKYLFWLLAGSFLIFLLSIYVIQPQVSLYIAKQQFDQGNIAGKERMIILMNSHLFPSQKWDLVTDYMLDDGLANQFDVVVGPSFSQIGEVDKEFSFTWEEKLPFLKQYIEEGPVNGYLVTTARELAYYYEIIGDYDQADHVLKEAIRRISETGNPWDQNELYLEQIEMEINRENYEKAESLLEELHHSLDVDDFYIRAELAQLKANMLLKQGNFKEAFVEVEKGLKQYKEEWKEHHTNADNSDSINNSVVFEELIAFERLLKHANQQENFETGNVQGRIVKNDGTPLAHVGVFLREENDVNRSLSWKEPYELVTDENGYFEFQSVIPGNYQIFLGFSFDQIDGWTWPVQMDDWIHVSSQDDITYNITLHELITIESPTNEKVIKDNSVYFEWEDVEEATYYNINLGIEMESASISSGFKTNVTENNLHVPIEDFYTQTVGVLLPGDDLEAPNTYPFSLLAFANTEGKFFWSVEAYDQNDHMLSRSNGYRLDKDSIGKLPFFHLQQRKLTDADQMLLNNDMKNALKAYKKAYEGDPNDTHSLRMITRLIGIDAKDDESEHKLVIPFLKDLVDKRAASPEDIWRLVLYYYELQDWYLFNLYFESYSTMLNGKISEYEKGIFAKSLMQQGKFETAENQLMDIIEMDYSNQFIGDLIAVNLYLHESIPKALTLAKRYPERLSAEQMTDWVTLLQQMEMEAATTSDYDDFLKKVLDLYMKGKEKELSHQISKIDQPALKKFMRSLQQ